MLVGDSKGVFDNLAREQASDDKDCALTLALVRQHASGLRTRPRWVAHDRNPTGPLTKHRGAHASALKELLMTGHFKLAPGAEELAANRLRRRRKGSPAAPRPECAAQPRL